METRGHSGILASLLLTAIVGCGSPSIDSKQPSAFVNPNKKDVVVDTPNGDEPVEVPDTTEPDIDPEPDVEPDPPDEPDEVVEMPPIPYEMADLPPDATAPWPGNLVSGALVEVALVIDGDTIKVETDDGLVTLRVEAINAPECDKRSVAGGKSCDPGDQDFAGEAEPFGVSSWEALRELVEGETVRIACLEENGECQQDRYGRSIGFVLRDGDDVSEKLARDGMVWTYTQFPPDNIYTYCVAEESAIDARRGMWSDGFDAVIAGMNSSTRNWYAYHDATCRQHAP